MGPRTLQRFLESIVWGEQVLCDHCQQIVATEHTHPADIGYIDAPGTAKIWLARQSVYDGASRYSSLNACRHATPSQDWFDRHLEVGWLVAQFNLFLLIKGETNVDFRLKPKSSRLEVTKKKSRLCHSVIFGVQP